MVTAFEADLDALLLAQSRCAIAAVCVSTDERLRQEYENRDAMKIAFVNKYGNTHNEKGE